MCYGKPVAVDPTRVIHHRYSMIIGITVGTGTQRRHQRDYVHTFKQVFEGISEGQQPTTGTKVALVP
jgi:hypothetical protein